jgi:prepilin-type N-terminal cleavage/methylation domain-containing protein
VKILYGFTLLEVMISMMLLALAMLAMDVMAVQSLHENQKIYFANVALNEMQNAAERRVKASLAHVQT